jgi:hypothetical protein
MPEPSSILEFPPYVLDSLPDRLFPTLTPDQISRIAARRLSRMQFGETDVIDQDCE